MKIQGIIPPMLTPFDPDGSVSEPRLRAFVDFLVPSVHGLFVCGSYGSGPLLSVEERQSVLEIVCNQLGGRRLLIAHVGAIDTLSAVRLARHAQDHGAQAVSATPPWYYSYGDSALREYFLALVRAVDIPVYAYDNPKTTGNPIPVGLLNQLAHEGLAGVKDSSFDIGKLYLMLRSIDQPDFDIVMGSESLMLPAFAMGVKGCVAGLANVFPEAMRHFYQVVTDEGSTSAERTRWQTNILKLWDALHIGPSVPTAYSILSRRGVDVGLPRPPMLPLDPGQTAKVHQVMEQLAETWRPEALPAL